MDAYASRSEPGGYVAFSNLAASRLDSRGLFDALAQMPGRESGRFAHLDARAVVGDRLTPHHIPQAALKFTSRADGGAIVIPEDLHRLTRTFGFRGAQLATAEADLPFRTVLARDIRDLRTLAGRDFNIGLRELITYYRTYFPELLSK